MISARSTQRPRFHRVLRTMLTAATLSAALFLKISLSPALAASRTESALLLVGGGNRPAEGLRLWSRTTDGPIVLVPWASEIPEETLQALQADFVGAGVPQTRLVFAPVYQPGSPEFIERATPLFPKARAVFFSGGDQNRLMQAISEVPGLASQLVTRFHGGTLAIAGTSAGTAIATALRFTGDEDLSRIDPSLFEGAPGLDFLQGMIVDQHFIRRSRMNRLVNAILRHPERVGLGIDEDCALWLPPQSSRARVLGAGSGLVRIQAQPSPAAASWKTEVFPVGSELELY